MTINNPTTEQIAVLIAEYQAACAAFDAIADDAPEDAHEAAARRSMVASTDLLAARPTEPAAMALQLKWIVADLEDGGSPSVEDILAHVADRLEAMAGAVVLPPIEAATTTRPRPIDVRRMLVAALDGMVERIVDLMCEDPFAKLEAQANLYAGIAEACSEKARVASMSMLKDEPDDKPDED
jgi:hypothetical protein